MSKKDDENETIGFSAIIIIVILAVVGLYYFFSHRPPTAIHAEDNLSIPLQAPAPIHEGTD